MGSERHDDGDVYLRALPYLCSLGSPPTGVSVRSPSRGLRRLAVRTASERAWRASDLSRHGGRLRDRWIGWDRANRAARGGEVVGLGLSADVAHGEIGDVLGRRIGARFLGGGRREERGCGEGTEVAQALWYAYAEL